MIGSASLANLAGGLGIATYILFFLLLLSANIALWKYIIVGGKPHHKDWEEWPKGTKNERK